MAMQFENASPVLSIGVDRTLFTLKQIALIFDKGSLQNVCIFKKSEAVEAIKIPLQVVQAIAALPTDILQIQYDNISKSSALTKAEYDLINSQKKVIAAQNAAPNGTVAAPTNQLSGPETFQIPAGLTDSSAPTLPTDALALSNACNLAGRATP
jgi:hypothetical protein